MEGLTEENGMKIIWKGSENIHGLINESLMESTKMTKSMVMEFTNGQTAENTMGTGH